MAFSAKPDILRAMTGLKWMLDELNRLRAPKKDGKCEGVYFLDFPEISRRVAALQTLILSSMPWCLCDCRADEQPLCPKCEGKGWLPAKRACVAQPRDAVGNDSQPRRLGSGPDDSGEVLRGEAEVRRDDA